MPDVISQEVLLGETLLMDVKSLAYFGLDEFGSGIWKALESCNDAEEVYSCLKKSSSMAAGMSEDAVASKFNAILRALEASRIITLEPTQAV